MSRPKSIPPFSTRGRLRFLQLSTNDKTIKLWKVFEKKVHHVTDFNFPRRVSGSLPHALNSDTPSAIGPVLALKLPQIIAVTSQVATKCMRVYANAHAYHINSISPNSDGTTFISADDLRVYLWDYEYPGTPNRRFLTLGRHPILCQIPSSQMRSCTSP